MTTKTELLRIKNCICDTVEVLGFPRNFGEIIADELGTEKQMKRMLSYLIQSKPKSMEEIADEMICIKEEFEKYRQRKISEYANQRYNEIVNDGLE